MIKQITQAIQADITLTPQQVHAIMRNVGLTHQVTMMDGRVIRYLTKETADHYCATEFAIPEEMPELEAERAVTSGSRAPDTRSLYEQWHSDDAQRSTAALICPNYAFGADYATSLFNKDNNCVELYRLSAEVYVQKDAGHPIMRVILATGVSCRRRLGGHKLSRIYSTPGADPEAIRFAESRIN